MLGCCFHHFKGPLFLDFVGAGHAQRVNSEPIFRGYFDKFWSGGFLAWRALSFFKFDFFEMVCLFCDKFSIFDI